MRIKNLHKIYVPYLQLFLQITVPDEEDALPVFEGAQKPIKREKEYLLFFDHSIGKMRIEKLSSIISVKKTRHHFLVIL